MNKQALIQVTSDNFEDQLFTRDAYKALTLTMSTGDYHTHTAVDVIVADCNWDDVVTLEQLSAGCEVS